MATRTQIVKKAYKCLDEVYPDTPLSSDIEEFRVADFVDDAIRFIGRVAPVRALGEGAQLTLSKTNDYTYSINVLGGSFVRLISIKMSDWDLPITDTFYTDHPRYKQQADPILKGSIKRPIVFVSNSNTLEIYSSGGSVDEARGFIVDKGSNVIIGPNGSVVSGTYTHNYPDQLSEAIAWKTVELVLSAMNDAQGVQFAQAQLKQLLEAL